MKGFLALLPLAVALCAYSLPATADIVFSNVNLASTNGGFTICGVAVGACASMPQAVAEEFTPSGNFILTDAKVVVGYIATYSSRFNVWLAQDSGGLPGSVIEQIGFDVSSGFFTGGVTADSIATPILLTSGASYWLVLTPADADTYAYWVQGGGSLPVNTCASPCVAVTREPNSTGGWFETEGTPSTLMQIDGIAFPPPVAAVPEPGYCAVLAIGMVALVSAVRGLKAKLTRQI